MKSSVIIEAPGRLAWHQRLASEASTAALWGGWLWLWAPLLKGAGQLASLGAQLPAHAFGGHPASGPFLLPSLAALAGTSGTLVAWRRLPRLRAKLEAPLPVSEYARHFELPEHVIEAGRAASVSVVHHHADGRIAGIECRAPEAQAAA